MSENPKIIFWTIDDNQWLERLRNGNFVWLCKEQCYAQVVFPYLPPDAGRVSGIIGIRKVYGQLYNTGEWGFGHIEDWMISLDGKGIDGTQLMLPTQGNLPDEPPSLDHPMVRQLMRRINELTHRVEQMEKATPNDDDFYRNWRWDGTWER